MMAGRMRYRLRVMEQRTVRDKFNAPCVEWVERGVIRAERVRNTGYRREEVDEHFADYRAEYNIRDAHEVKEGWQVEELGGLTYTVTATIPNRARGMITLICERLNT